MKITRKISALVLVLLMVMSSFTALPLTVSAAEAQEQIGTVRQRFETTAASGYGKVNVKTNGELTLSNSASALHLRKADTLPSSYSSVDNGYITSVRNQGNYGTCWAFAICAASEASLIKNNGYAKNTTSLSPAHVAYWTFAQAYDKLGLISEDSTGILTSDDAYDVGGSSFDGVYTLAKGTGPADEKTIPYGTYAGDSISSTKSYQVSNGAQLKNVYWVSYQNRDVVKSMIMKYGAGTFGYYSSYSDATALKSGTYNGKPYTSYGYVQSVSSDSNSFKWCDHDVTVVGWDDAFPKENFKSSTITEDGAWLIKNSWGTSYGASGYYWISYQDSSNLADMAAFFEYETEAPYDNIYQYDGTSSRQYYYYPSNMREDGGYMANVYTADSSEMLKAVSFFTLDANVDYQVEIYKDVKTTPTSGTLVAEATTTGTVELMQYKTVALNAPVKLSKGDTYAVVVKFSPSSASTTNTAYLPVDCSSKLSGYFEYKNAVAANQSFYSADKSSWLDISKESESYSDGTTESNYSFRIKALTDEVPVDITGVSLNKTSITLPQGNSEKLTLTIEPDEATGTVVWTSENEEVATVTNGTVRAVGIGTTTIKATVDDVWTATCDVVVTEFEGGFTELTDAADFTAGKQMMFVGEYDGKKYALKAAEGSASKTLAGAVVEEDTSTTQNVANTSIKKEITENKDETLVWLVESDGNGAYLVKSKSEGTYLQVPSSGNGLSLAADSSSATSFTLDSSKKYLKTSNGKGVFLLKDSLCFKTAAESNAGTGNYVTPTPYAYKSGSGTEGEDVPKYTLTVSIEGNNGAVNCNGTEYRNGSTITVAEGTPVTITPVADTGYKFDFWWLNGETINETGDAYTFTMTSAQNGYEITAGFVKLPSEPIETPENGVYTLCNDETLSSGKYIIAANVSGTYYAMAGNTLDNGKYSPSDALTISNGVVQNVDDAWVYDITKTAAGNYNIYDNAKGQYVTYISSTNLGNSATEYDFAVSLVNGEYKIVSTSNNSRGIIYRAGTTNKFGAYSTSNTGSEYHNITLFKLTDAGETPSVKTYKITIGTDDGGAVKYGNTSYTNGQSFTVAEGTSVTLTAVPNSGYEVDQWLTETGAELTGDTSYTFTPTADCEILVTFKIKETTLKVANVVAAPTSLKVSVGDTIYLTCETKNATIYYSLDGITFNTYSNGAIVANTLPLTVYAYATCDGYETSDTVSYTFTETTPIDPPVTVEGTFTLVTTASSAEFPSGRYIIAVNVDGSYKAANAWSSSYYTVDDIAAANISDDTINDGTGFKLFDINKVDGGYSIYDVSEEKYLAFNSSSKMKLQDEPFVFTVSTADSTFRFDIPSTTRSLLYNKQSPRISSYLAGTSYYDLSFFKLNGSVVEPVKEYTITVNTDDNASVSYNGKTYTNGQKITVEEGTEVTLTAVVKDGYVVDQWLTADNTVLEGAESYTFTPSADCEIYLFTKAAAVKTASILATVESGNGNILINGDVAGDDVISVNVGSTVAITAAADADYYLDYFTVNGTRYTSDTSFEVTSEDDIIIEVYFKNKFDFNGDNALNSDDVTALLNHLAGVQTITSEYLDVNGDGSVNLLDAYVLNVKCSIPTKAESKAALKGEAVTTGGFEKVTDISTLADGDKIMFVYNGLAMDTEYKSGKTAGVAVTFNSGAIVNPDSALLWTVGIDATATTNYKYTFLSNSDSASYLYHSGSGTNLVIGATASKFAVDAYTASTGENLYKVYMDKNRGIAYRKSTFNLFGGYSTTNLTEKNTEYFGVCIYKYNPDLVLDGEQYTVTVNVVEGQESYGTVSESATVYSNGSVTLTATPAEGYMFEKWTITAADGTATEVTTNPYTLDGITQNYTVTASFVTLPPQPVCSSISITAVRNNVSVSNLKAGDVINFTAKNAIAETYTLEYSLDNVNWVDAKDGYTVTGSETFPFVIYARANAENCTEVTFARTFNAYEAIEGKFVKVTDVSTIKDGDKIMFVYGSNALNVNADNYKQLIELVDGAIVNPEDALVWNVRINAEATNDYKYKFEKYDSDGSFLNMAKTSTISTTASGASFSIGSYTNTASNEELFHVKISGQTRELSYRTGTFEKFACYSSSNVTAASTEYYGVSIYKLSDGEEPEPTYDDNDFNHDGKVDAADVQALQSYLADTLTDADVIANIEAHGDVNKDGVINLLDAYILFATVSAEATVNG